MVSYEIDPIYLGNDILDSYVKLEEYLNISCSANKKVSMIIPTLKSTSLDARWLIIWEIID